MLTLRGKRRRINTKETRKMLKISAEHMREQINVLFSELTLFLKKQSKYSLEEIRNGLLGFVHAVEVNGGLSETQIQLAERIRKIAGNEKDFSKEDVEKIRAICGGLVLETF